jgi:hypothetical protein
MMVKIESKTKLAKLLAMEDIDVEHRQVKTAMFDVKSRCLTLPTWKDMPNHLYDLLVGHEVGHALYTPADEETLKTIIEKTSKHCVNVVEDARIESLMKRRYPGLVKQFYAGYGHLIKEDFFGLSKIDVNKLNLLDKINLHFKVPTAVAGLFEFNEIEQSFVDRIENIKRFKEVEEICIEICEYIKENREEQDEDESIFPEDSYSMTADDSEEGESDMGDSEEGETETSEKGQSNETEEMEETEEEDDWSDNEDLENGVSNSGASENDETVEDDLKSETYENFENSVKDLADIDVENVYCTIPETIRYDNLIDYKEVYKNINTFYSIEHYEECKENAGINHRYNGWYHSATDFTNMTQTIFDNSKKTLDNIKKNSIKNVNHMAMEFERKKCADIYKRTSFAKTGVLDTNKMFSAKYNEDVFKKNIKTPEGKNHGLVMFIDWSGSMSIHLQGCAKQVIEFVLFCKKVNIPFEVYSFSDVGGNTYADNGVKKQTFIYKPGDLVCDSKITLRNYFSSRMNARELNDAMLKLCVITDSFKGGYQCYPIPDEDALGYTPLNGAILFSEHVIRDFQKKNNLQEVHAVWITDGEGNNSYSIHKAEPYYSKRMIIQDKKMKKNYPRSRTRRNITSELFEIVKDRLGCNIIGFFLDTNYGKKNHMMNHIYQSGMANQTNITEWMKQSKKDGYFIKKEQGYDEYYVISNAPKIIKPVEMDDKMTNRKLATVFSSKNNEFKNSRVILSKFIDLITARI